MGCETKLYAIREVAEATGVKPVTLRAWQRRYNLIQPQRTEKGHRLYTQADIDTIHAIQRWLAKGVAIGKVKGLLLSGDEETGAEQVDNMTLDEVESLLEALAALNQGKAESILSGVFKEYPLKIVTQQFVMPVTEALDKVKSSQRTLQKALFQALMLTRISAIIDAENKAATKGKCLFVSLDPVGSVFAWLEALQLSETGLRVIVLDGADDLTGLSDGAALEFFSRLHVFSNRALPDVQRQHLVALSSQWDERFSASDVLRALHLD